LASGAKSSAIVVAMTVISAIGDRAARLAQRTIPDPFVIAILLAVVTLIGGSLHLGDPGRMTRAFAAGMMESSLLAFAFEMALILVTGHALADAPSVKALLWRLASIPKTPASAAALVALIAMVLALFNWGLGLVGGAFAAREVTRAFRRRGVALNPALVAAAGYMGMLVWHGGLSGSAPLKVAVDGAFGPALSVEDTLFSSMNIGLNLSLLVFVPLLFAALARGDGTAAPADRALLVVEVTETVESSDVVDEGPLSWLERSALVTVCFVVPVAIALVQNLGAKGVQAVNLSFVILAFWAAGMALHRDPLAYSRSFADGTRGAAGILLQFPLYFGILAAARESGALESAARALNEIAAQSPVATDVAAPVLTFLTAGLVNLFVPSGGGQWVLQSPIILEAVDAFSLPRAKMVMAFCYGDELTNLLQPFWALPLLSITELKAREVMGFTILAMLLCVPIFITCLALF